MNESMNKCGTDQAEREGREEFEDNLVGSGELSKLLEQTQGCVRWIEGGRVWKQDE